jgi:hypothetical protein
MKTNCETCETPLIEIKEQTIGLCPTHVEEKYVEVCSLCKQAYEHVIVDEDWGNFCRDCEVFDVKIIQIPESEVVG